MSEVPLYAPSPSERATNPQHRIQYFHRVPRFALDCAGIRRAVKEFKTLKMPIAVQDFGFLVSNFRCRVPGIGFRVSGFGFHVSCLELHAFRFSSRFSCFVFRVSRLRSGVSHFVFCVSCLGFRTCCSMTRS